jgi:hypothetical protein
LEEALFWDNLIQNNLVRASPSEIDSMEPGIICALTGLWQGRAKWVQESAPKSKPKTNEPKKKKSNARK